MQKDLLVTERKEIRTCPWGEDVETSRGKTLVYVILVTEKRIESEDDVRACVAIAFPEQFVPASEHSFTLRDHFDCFQLTYEQWLKKPLSNTIMSLDEFKKKGIRVLPPKSNIKSGDLFPLLLSILIEKINPAFATSDAFVRKWAVIDVPAVKKGLFSKPKPSKILTIGIYSV